jgi:hypothetical protein
VKRESTDNGEGKATTTREPQPQPKGRQGGKGVSYRGTAQRARERFSEAIDPKVAIIAKDPLRAEILAVAIQRLYSPSEFAKDAGVSIGVSAYAFKTLAKHDIIELVKTEKVRGAIKHLYRANEAAFFGDRDWGALASVLRPGVIGATIGNFNDRVAQAEKTGKLYSREDVCIYWAPRDLDEIAWAEHVKVVRWCIEESEHLEAETVERRAKGESTGCFKATFGVFAFPSPTHSEVKAHERRRQKEERKRAHSAGQGTGRRAIGGGRP